MEFECGTSLVPETAETRQHFFLLWFPGLLDAGNFGKLFFEFLRNRDTNLKLACLPARSPLPIAALPSVSPIPSAPLTNPHKSILMVLPWRAELCDA